MWSWRQRGRTVNTRHPQTTPEIRLAPGPRFTLWAMSSPKPHASFHLSTGAPLWRTETDIAPKTRKSGALQPSGTHLFGSKNRFTFPAYLSSILENKVARLIKAEQTPDPADDATNETPPLLGTPAQAFRQEEQDEMARYAQRVSYDRQNGPCLGRYSNILTTSDRCRAKPRWIMPEFYVTYRHILHDSDANGHD